MAKKTAEASTVHRIGRPRGWRNMTDAERDAWASMDETERQALLSEVRERAKAA